MSRKGRKNREHGQITVLMVFAIVALFGVAALAIDGGLLYLQRRSAQSVADDVAMTGALAITKGYTGSQIETILLERAIQNGFDDTSDDVDIQILWPPQAPNPYAGDLSFIQVIITSRIPLAFTQFVFQGSLEVTVESVSHARLPTEILPGASIHAGNPSTCMALEFSGNPNVVISGGGDVHSNSTAECACGGSGIRGDASINVLDGGEISLSGCWKEAGAAGEVTPDPDEYVAQKELNEPPVPDCSGLPTFDAMSFNGVETISPGIYHSIKLNASADVTLEPGLYCMNGSNGGWNIETMGGSRLYGDGVIFYLMDSAGGWKSAGGSELYLYAPTDFRDASNVQWAGMLIYTHPDNTNDLVLTGTANSYFEGTIYAPGSHCDIEGNGGAVAFKSQFLCDTVRVNGTGDLQLYYDPSRNYYIPPAVDLAQ